MLKSNLRKIISLLLALMLVLTACSLTVSTKQTDERAGAASGDAGSSSSVAVSRNYPAYDGPPGTWAVYWYICGSDLESGGGFATVDLKEMAAVTLPDNVTVVIQTGGSEAWQNGFVSAEALERYIYVGNELYRVDTQPLASMGDPNTFAGFLEYCNTYYPAEKQVVLLWDHGGGSLFGMELDALYDFDALTLPEFKSAIEAMPAASGQYELVGFDACLMATVDIAGILAGNARYLVASEELEPGIGWNYTGLFSALANGLAADGAALGRAICDSYFSACEEYGLSGEATLSVVDLSKADALIAAYNAVGDEALLQAAKEKQTYLSEFGRAAYDSEYYGGGNYEMVDLGDLVRNAGSLLPENGKTLLDTLNEAVVYQVKGEYRAQASGLSCYFLYSGNPESCELFRGIDASPPFTYFFEYALKGEMSPEGMEYIGSIAQQTGVITPELEPLPPPESLGMDRFPVFVGADGHWRMELGKELASNLAAVYVNLMWHDPAGGLQVLWGTNQDLTADWENGVFSEDFHDNWGSIDETPVYMEPIGMSPGRVLYAVPILLNSEPYTMDVGYNYTGAYPGTGYYEILGVWKKDTEKVRAAGKTMRQLVPGDVVEPVHYLMPLHDDGTRTVEEMPMGVTTVTEDTIFHARTVGGGYFRLTFQMVDYAGNIYYSDEATIRVREGKIERLPDGIGPDIPQPEGSIPAEYVNTDTWLHEGWNQEITYYTAGVGYDMYVSMAQSLGLPNAESGDQTSGMGYTIQLESDTVNIADYAGARKVYLAGYYYAADTVWHRRDIVFMVESITEVW